MRIKIFFIFFLISAAIAVGACFELLPGKKEASEYFSIKRGDNVFEIIQNLKSQGYIRSKIIFLTKAGIGGNLRKFKAGTYDIRGLNPNEIIKKLVLAQAVPVEFTVIPGQAIIDIAASLQSAGIAEKQDFFAYAAGPEAGGKLELQKQLAGKYDFLQNLPESASLEGFLYPDTYYLDQNANAGDAVNRMLDNFGAKIAPELPNEIKKQQKTVFEIVIMASLLEKEVITMRDKKIVAGILYKRLEAKMPLQVDSAVLYGNNGKFNKDSDSFYNTYKYAGFPPGPICNPGIGSIEAAIYPQESVYWYYLSARDGTTIFSRNYDEHLANRAKYLSN